MAIDDEVHLRTKPNLLKEIVLGYFVGFKVPNIVNNLRIQKYFLIIAGM